jgi:hypothetical protein
MLYRIALFARREAHARLREELALVAFDGRAGAAAEKRGGEKEPLCMR